jgi:hypothetical protein
VQGLHRNAAVDIAKDLWSAEKFKNKRVREDFERVFTAIGAMQRVHSKAQLDLNNIESIFTALELGKIIQKVPGMDPDAISSTIDALKSVIVQTLEHRIAFPIQRGKIGVPEPYGGFTALLAFLQADALPNQSVSVITFNYDIAVDTALFRAGMGPDYVIESIPETRGGVQLMK